MLHHNQFGDIFPRKPVNKIDEVIFPEDCHIKGRQWYEEKFLPRELQKEDSQERLTDLAQKALKRQLILNYERMNLMSTIHCTHCGQKIVRGEETAEQWAKRRRCQECQEAKIKLSGTEHARFCRWCGESITFC